MSSRRHRVALRGLSLLTLAGAGLLAGCGLGPGKTPTGVHLEITRDFGSNSLRSLQGPRARGQETVMSLLLRNAAVTTRYGGGFVQSIDGHAGGYEGSEPVDWFYYINGVQAPKGAADTDVRPGDRVWWDLHDWSQTEEVPAVVGSFPQPFLNGFEGHRAPVRIECAAPEGAACHEVASQLRATGVTSGLATLGPGGEAPETLRLLVGTWAQVRNDPGAQLLQRGPKASGVYARVPADGQTLALLDAQGQVVRTLTGSAGLIAATRYTGEDPEWLITGTDSAGVLLAAHALDEHSLHDRFAIALSAGRSATAGDVLPLPQPGP